MKDKNNKTLNKINWEKPIEMMVFDCYLNSHSWLHVTVKNFDMRTHLYKIADKLGFGRIDYADEFGRVCNSNGTQYAKVRNIPKIEIDWDKPIIARQWADSWISAYCMWQKVISISDWINEKIDGKDTCVRKVLATTMRPHDRLCRFWVSKENFILEVEQYDPEDGEFYYPKRFCEGILGEIRSEK
jgi:hypothetical protein